MPVYAYLIYFLINVLHSLVCVSINTMIQLQTSIL
jgi:hypothetical protein